MLINFILASLLTTALFLIFRGFRKYEVKVLPAVVLNYITCALLGAFTMNWERFFEVTQSTNILLLASIAGVTFISTFYLMAQSSQVNGVAFTSIASKVSMVVPVALNMLLWRSDHKIELKLFLGLLLAVISVVLSVELKKKTNSEAKPLLILLVFIGTGVVDSWLNFSMDRLPFEDAPDLFPMVCFGVAGILGVITLWFQSKLKSIGPKEVKGGVLLGAVNFASVLFFLSSLQDFEGDGALFFPAMNLSVILFSALFSALMYKERITLRMGISILFAFAGLLMLIPWEMMSDG